MSMELLVIFIVALMVFGPKKLPMLAAHLGQLIRQLNQLKTSAAAFWQQQLNEHQLQENQRKAEEAERQYKKIAFDLNQEGFSLSVANKARDTE